jgi:hypothetical protein
MPMRDGTIELRQKGTSFRLIRKLIATVGVAVGAAIMGVVPRGAELQFSVSTNNINQSLVDALPFRTRSECNLPPFRQRLSRSPATRR